MASRVYRELTREQKRMVYVLFKKMTGVAKIALKWGKSEGEAEGAVRQFLIEMGVVQAEVVVVKGVRKRPELLKEDNRRRYQIVSSVPSRLLANLPRLAIKERRRQPQHSFW